MLRNLALRKKLIGGFGVIMLVMTVEAGFSIVEIRGLTAFVARAAAIHELTKVGTLAADMIGLERAIVLYSIFDDKASVAQYKSRLAESSKAFVGTLDAFGNGVSSQNTKNTIGALRSRYSAWLAMHAEIVGALDKQQVDVAQKKVADPAFTATVDEIRRLSNEMSEHEAQSIKEEASSTALTSLIGFGVLAALSLGTGTFVLLYIRQVSNSLASLTDSLAGNSDQVNTLAVGVHSASESLARGSAEQAASLEETAASTEEITSMTRQNATNSQSAAALMGEVDQHIKACNRTLESTLVSMEEINTSSNKISKIIRVIDEIAFQTNILALNAAVEAARAGEAGLGFAVVADEVRNLAQRSAQAAKDTAAMIEESIAKSNGGSSELQHLTEMIREITGSAAKVKTLVDSVSSGSQEQARGIDQISRAVSQMDQLTQNTAASAQESASASDKLSIQAGALNDVVFELRTLVAGGSKPVV